MTQMHTHKQHPTSKRHSDPKAISLNLMHSDKKVTDGVYTILSDMEVRDRVGDLGEKEISLEKLDTSDIILKIVELLSKIDPN